MHNGSAMRIAIALGALVVELAPDATTTCYVAGCIVEHAEQAQSAFAADTTWTGGKQWIGATLILYRPACRRRKISAPPATTASTSEPSPPPVEQQPPAI